MFYRNLLNENVSMGGEYAANVEKTKSESKTKKEDKKPVKPEDEEKYRRASDSRQDGHRHRRHNSSEGRGDSRISHRDYDEHSPRKRESTNRNKGQQDTGSKRQEQSQRESDRERHHRKASEHSERHRRDSSGDRKDRDKKPDDKNREGKEEDSEIAKHKSESKGVKIDEGLKAQDGIPKTQIKFAKRSTEETVMSARDRYLARKQAREATKAAGATAGSEEN